VVTPLWGDYLGAAQPHISEGVLMYTSNYGKGVHTVEFSHLEDMKWSR
jgi:hypothetical protein